MKLFKHIIVFLVINFAALYIGILFMNDGPRTEWYLNLNKAPWTPPGWFFGVAWTTIMICFSIYMAFVYKLEPHTKVKALFTFQFIFNIIWNFIFFNQHFILLGVICLVLLTLVVGKILFDYKNIMTFKSLLIAPYFIWICIATSLNTYILLYN